MRGEQDVSLVIQLSNLGSPPHARGAGDRIKWKGGDLGITPACAGSSVKYQVSFSWDKDHPRIRGEQYIAAVIAPYDAGSPPHTRGAV